MLQMPLLAASLDLPSHRFVPVSVALTAMAVLAFAFPAWVARRKKKRNSRRRNAPPAAAPGGGDDAAKVRIHLSPDLSPGAGGN